MDRERGQCRLGMRLPEPAGVPALPGRMGGAVWGHTAYSGVAEGAGRGILGMRLPEPAGVPALPGVGRRHRVRARGLQGGQRTAYGRGRLGEPAGVPALPGRRGGAAWGHTAYSGVAEWAGRGILGMRLPEPAGVPALPGRRGGSWVA